MTTTTQTIEALKVASLSSGLGFRFRKSGSLKPLKPCGGQCLLRVFGGGSVVITGIDSITDSEWRKIAALAWAVHTGGWYLHD